MARGHWPPPPSWEDRSTLKVAYAEGGPMFILYWRESDVGHHVILARKTSSIDTSFKSILEKHGAGVVVESFLSVRVVSPPTRFSKAFRKTTYEKEVQGFQWTVTSRIHKYVDTYHALPPGVVRCLQYQCTLDDPGPDWEDVKHTYCKNCEEGFVLVGCTWEQLFEANKELYFEEHPPYARQEVSFVVSRAPKAIVTRKCYGIYTNFGPHSEGLILGRTVSEFDFRLDYSNIPILYYQNPVVLDHSRYVEMIAGERRSVERWREEQRVLNQLDEAKQSAKEVRFVEQVFSKISVISKVMGERSTK